MKQGVFKYYNLIVAGNYARSTKGLNVGFKIMLQMFSTSNANFCEWFL